jgi:putative hydrolase of the HAD superfamily
VRQILARGGIEEFFPTVISSGTEGVAKPDPEIFRRALARHQVTAGETFYVGNLAFTDAQASSAAGLHSVWLNRAGTGFGEDPPEITSLLEVPLCIRRLEKGEWP